MTEKIKRLDLNTSEGAQLNMDALYQIAPSVFTESRDEKTGELKRVVNFDALRQLLGDNAVDDSRETYEFRWVGKDAAKAEAARPTDKTLRPVVEDSVDWDTTKNLYIEGDNLEVLKLLQRSYMGKVKMIYIDPPYNTGNDFVYHDDFAMSSEEYDEASGAVDDLGNKYVKNTETSGRFHSDWCNMIYPRLMVARSLLSEDGVIFISIDDNEVENLRKICDEVFGVQNRLDRGCMIWVNRGSSKGFRKIVKNHEYIIAYGKEQSQVNSVYGDNFASSLGTLEHYCFNKPSEKNPYSNVKFSKGCRIEGIKDITFSEYVGKEVKLQIVNGNMCFKDGILQEDVILRGTFPYVNQIKEYFINKPKGLPTYDSKGQEWIEIFFNSNGMPRYRKTRNNEIISSVIDESTIPNYGSEDIKELLGEKEYFNFPKPKELLFHLMSYFLPDDSIFLDFFSGSASSAHAVMSLNALKAGNRKFIMVQLPEEIQKDSEACKAGYKTICEIGKERIRRAATKIKEESPLTTQDLDTGFRVFRLDGSNFNQGVKASPSEYNQQQLDLFADNIKPDRTDLDLLFGSILAWGLQLDMPMETEEVDGCKIYTVNDGDLVACFAEKVTDKVIEAMAEKDPLRVLFRDACFDSDDKKINLFETFKQKLDWTDDEAYNNIRVI